MDTIIISPESDMKNFKNYKIVNTVFNPFVLPYEGYHADMQLCVIKDEIIVAPMFFEYYKKMLPGKKLICGEANPDGHYPKSVAYNVAMAGNYAICKEDFTDRIILQRLKSSGMEIINVRQGYSKCSVCVAGDKIITSDEGIYRAAKDKLDVLLIEKGHIRLLGCEYGFIGGASGFDGKLFFCGDITAHPDYKRIADFLESREIIYEYTDSPLTDVGTVMFV